jgi:hypothetical protein
MKKIVYLIVFIFCLFIFGISSFPANAQTATFSLTAPTGTLQRGQNVDFTISINTNGQTVNTASVGMTYDATLLEFVSSTPGDALTAVDAQDQGGGKIVFVGTNTNGFSGSGTFAVVTFTIIATSANSTQICVLFTPGVTPTTAPIVPTALPKTGSLNQFAQGTTIGLALFLIITSGFILNKKELVKPPHINHTKTLH